jgi:hypothetical protein
VSSIHQKDYRDLRTTQTSVDTAAIKGSHCVGVNKKKVIGNWEDKPNELK